MLWQALATLRMGRYQQKGISMPYTMEDYRRDLKKEALEELTPQEILDGLPPEKRAKLLEALLLEQRLQGLSKEEIETYLRNLHGESPAK